MYKHRERRENKWIYTHLHGRHGELGAAGGAGSVTTKQKSKPGDTKCHPSTITFNLHQSSQMRTVPPPSSPSPFPSLSPSPALAGIIKTPRDGCKLLDVFIKTNQSIFLCGIISLELSYCSTELPAVFGSCCRPRSSASFLPFHWIIPGMCLGCGIKACFTPDSAAVQPALLRLS